jgi:hypothetical protein
LPFGVFGDDFRAVVSELYQPADCGEFIDELLLSDWPQILGRRFQKKSSEHRRAFLIAILKAGISGKELHTEGIDYSGLFSRQPSVLVDDWQDKIERVIRSKEAALTELAITPPNDEDVPSQLEIALEDRKGVKP